MSWSTLNLRTDVDRCGPLTEIVNPFIANYRNKLLYIIQKVQINLHSNLKFTKYSIFVDKELCYANRTLN